MIITNLSLSSVTGPDVEKRRGPHLDQSPPISDLRMPFVTKQ